MRSRMRGALARFEGSLCKDLPRWRGRGTGEGEFAKKGGLLWILRFNFVAKFELNSHRLQNRSLRNKLPAAGNERGNVGEDVLMMEP